MYKRVDQMGVTIFLNEKKVCQSRRVNIDLARGFVLARCRRDMHGKFIASQVPIIHTYTDERKTLTRCSTLPPSLWRESISNICARVLWSGIFGTPRLSTEWRVNAALCTQMSENHWWFGGSVYRCLSIGNFHTEGTRRGGASTPI